MTPVTHNEGGVACVAVIPIERGVASFPVSSNKELPVGQHSEVGVAYVPIRSSEGGVSSVPVNPN